MDNLFNQFPLTFMTYKCLKTKTNSWRSWLFSAALICIDSIPSLFFFIKIIFFWYKVHLLRLIAICQFSHVNFNLLILMKIFVLSQYLHSRSILFLVKNPISINFQLLVKVTHVLGPKNSQFLFESIFFSLKNIDFKFSI